VSLVALAACGSGSTSDSTATSSSPASTAAAAAAATDCVAVPISSTTSTTTSPAGGSSSGAPAAPPGGAAPGGTATVTPTGSYALSRDTATKTAPTFTATAANTSGLLVTNAGALTLTNPTVITSGDSSSTDESSFYGLDAGVLATSGSAITVDGGSVTTTGTGANGVFATGAGSTVAIYGTTIAASGAAAHGIMVSAGGTITARDLTVSTQDKNGAAVATDRGGGTITVERGSYRTAGVDSPGLYSTGTLIIDDATVAATGAEVAVIEGSNSITITNSRASGTKKSGIMIFQSFSGDAQGSDGRFSMTGGSLTQAEGPLFFVTNTTGTITLHAVNATAGSGILLKAVADQWGTTGSNGGHATLNASSQTLAGNVVVDAVSNATIALTDASALTATIDAAHTAKSVTVSLDASSTWTLTGDSHVTVLDDTAGLSGTAITNIIGNGHTVQYDASANPTLAARTYSLSGGGTLTPA